MPVINGTFFDLVDPYDNGTILSSTQDGKVSRIIL